MEHAEAFKKVYLENADWLEKAKSEYIQAKDEDARKFYSLKYLSVLIYNDLTRDFLNLETNPSRGLSKLLSLKPIILTLFEAHLWYKQEGSRNLLEIAKSLEVHDEVREKLASLKSIKSTNIERYSNFRNKLSGHYTLESFQFIEELGAIPYSEFEEDALRVISYANQWLEILKYVGTKA